MATETIKMVGCFTCAVKRMNIGRIVNEGPFPPTGERGPPSKPSFHRGLLRVILETPQLEVNIFSLYFLSVQGQLRFFSAAVILYSSNVCIIVYVCSGSVWIAPGFAISKTPRQSESG